MSSGDSRTGKIAQLHANPTYCGLALNACPAVSWLDSGPGLWHNHAMHQPFKKALVVLCFLLSSAFVKVSAQGTYSKIEASFNITNLTTDPFDYTVTDVRVNILQPDNSTVSLPAFFYGGTTW